MTSRFLLLIACVAGLSSCSSVYRSGQTPDDVYYSPAPAARVHNGGGDEYVNVAQNKDGRNYQSYDEYTDNYRDDRFLRMSVGNPYYMNSYNMYSGFDWRYNSFYDGFNYGFYSPWNNYFAWNNFYNPYYGAGMFGYYGGMGYYGSYYGGGYIAGVGSVKSFSVAPMSKPRVFNVSSYSPRANPRTYSTGNYYNNTNARYNNSNGNNRSNTYYTPGTGGRSINNSSSNSNNNTYTPSRSFTPSSSGGGGGGGGVSRPSRGN